MGTDNCVVINLADVRIERSVLAELESCENVCVGTLMDYAPVVQHGATPDEVRAAVERLYARGTIVVHWGGPGGQGQPLDRATFVGLPEKTNGARQ